MKVLHVLLFAVSVLFAGAREPEFERFTYVTEPPPRVADVELDYELHLPPSAAFPKLHQELLAQFLDERPAKAEVDAVFKHAATRFDSIMAQTRVDLPEYKTNYSEIRRVTPAYREGNLLVMEVYLWDYTGGAHGNGAGTYLNWDLKRQQPLGFDDLFKPDSKGAVLELVLAHLRMQNDVKTDEELAKAGFWLDDFFLGEMRPDTDAVDFLYNPYAIGPYAMGTVVVSVPRTQLAPHIPATSLLHRTR